jgi:hypothetical protein
MSHPNEKSICQVGLSEKDGNNRPGIVEEMLADIREAIPGLFTDLSTAGKGWLRGKSDQEAARAKQILADVIDRIGRLKLDERNQEHRQDIETARHDVDMQAKRVDLYFSSLERAVAVVRTLTEMGVDVDISAILRGLPMHIDLVDLESPGAEIGSSGNLEGPPVAYVDDARNRSSG